MKKMVCLSLSFMLINADEIKNRDLITRNLVTSDLITNKEFIHLYKTISLEAQKSIKSFLFQACAFEKIKEDSPKTVNTNLIITTAYDLWQKTLTYTHLKLQLKMSGDARILQQKKTAKEHCQEAFNALQKILVPQSRHFFESSNIIRTIKDIVKLDLPQPTPQQLQKQKKIVAEEKNWLAQLKKAFNTINSFINNLFKTKESVPEIAMQQSQQAAYIEKLIIIDLIKQALTASQEWLKNMPNAPYKKSPLCILKRSIKTYTNNS